MASLFIFNGGGRSKAEEDLAMPDDTEIEDHPTHVRRDGLRFQLLIRRMDVQEKMLNRIQYLAFAVFCWMVVTSEQFREFWKVLH